MLHGLVRRCIAALGSCIRLGKDLLGLGLGIVAADLAFLGQECIRSALHALGVWGGAHLSALPRPNPNEASYHRSVFEHFTDRARRVVHLAQDEARVLNHNYIGTEHLLLGLIREGDGIGAQALEALGISLSIVRKEIEEIIGSGGQVSSGNIPFTPRAKKALDLALQEARDLGHNYIGTEHLLLGLVREGDGVAAQVLSKLGADLARVRVQVVRTLSVRGAAPVSTPPLCSFCGRDLVDAVHYVRGQEAAICDACVAAAHVAISEADADQQALFLRARGDGT